MTTPQQSGIQWVADVQASLESLAHDNVDLQRQVNVLRARLDDYEGIDPPTDTPDPTPTNETELGIGVGFWHHVPAIKPDGDGGYIIDEDYADLMGKWSFVRYLDWCSLLNKQKNWTWQTRVTDADYFKTYQKEGGAWRRWRAWGVSLEAIIAFANKTHTDVWWTAPMQADADYMRHAGRLFADTLDPDLTVILEIGNEVWDARRGWRYYDLTRRTDGSIDFGAAMQAYAQDIKVKGHAFIEGGFPKERLIRVAGGQKDNIGVLAGHVLPQLGPDDYDAITCSGYFGNSPDTWRADLESTIKALRAHAALAESHGKQLLIYEFESHIYLGVDDTSLHHSPEVIAGKQRILDLLDELGVKYIGVFQGPGYAYARSPWPNYTPDLKPSPTVKALGWPTLGGDE
jgi:hypothetical protein